MGVISNREFIDGIILEQTNIDYYGKEGYVSVYNDNGKLCINNQYNEKISISDESCFKRIVIKKDFEVINKTDMTTGRYAATASAVNGLIYVIGGRNAAPTLQTNEMYDPVTNTWTTKANMTTGRRGLTSAVVDGKIYCIGGDDGNYSNKNEMYDPVANTWTTKTAMTTARSYLTSSTVNGKIYCIGGYNGSYLNNNEMYDPVGNTWTTKSAMTTSRNMLTSAVVNDMIYCMGGATTSSTNLNQMYDTINNTWISKTSLSTAISGHVSGVINDQIYCLAGGTLDIQCYNTYFNLINTSYPGVSFTSYNTMSCAATVNNIIYVFNGSTTTKTTIKFGKKITKSDNPKGYIIYVNSGEYFKFNTDVTLNSINYNANVEYQANVSGYISETNSSTVDIIGYTSAVSLETRGLT
jgi:N-acetylneuraminic acid mutarotase